mmetsp:Transcript_15509/g.32761  ORF Transcript_15509/g.32761 Transcript_15509/m.32761 type:complete len:208 (-) Transcript_15509:762-1385(-)
MARRPDHIPRLTKFDYGDDFVFLHCVVLDHFPLYKFSAALWNGHSRFVSIIHLQRLENILQYCDTLVRHTRVNGIAWLEVLHGAYDAAMRSRDDMHARRQRSNWIAFGHHVAHLGLPTFKCHPAIHLHRCFTGLHVQRKQNRSGGRGRHGCLSGSRVSLWHGSGTQERRSTNHCEAAWGFVLTPSGSKGDSFLLEIVKDEAYRAVLL